MPFHYLPQAEEGSPTGPRQPRADRCPPPPRTLPPGACQATRCQADSECPRHRRCCYNGCAYACLEAVPPPPVLDWLVQPKPRWLGGNGWLLDGPEEVLQAEACSTTEDGAEPLLCPSGYECHILRPGDPAQGIPNHGQCVKQRRQAEGRILRQKLHKQYPDAKPWKREKNSTLDIMPSATEQNSRAPRNSQSQCDPAWRGNLGEAPDKFWVPAWHPGHMSLQLLGDF
ncbi:hypothetical protein U0070_018819 [Myodes glareolus]|uniref:WAP four-disulfide core domain protein 1 n=1 Tax=Myodes glareolus TaxID=447135 RepID=A0AAW0JVL2_MYOGA